MAEKAGWFTELAERARAAAEAEAVDGVDPMILVCEDTRIASELVAAVVCFYAPGLAAQVVRLVDDLCEAEATLDAIRRVSSYDERRGMPSSPRFVLNGNEVLAVLDRRRGR